MEEMNVYKRPVRKTRKRFFNVEGAAEYIGDLSKNTEIFGITKGQFSIIDVIKYVLDFAGPSDLLIATWTAAQADIKKAFEFLENGNIRQVKFLVDRGFINRQPEYCAELKRLFGDESIRFLRAHAKFCVIQNEKWNFVIRTSMNLNENKRMENFEITEDKDFCEYFKRFFDVAFDGIPVNKTDGNIDQIEAFDKVGNTDFLNFKI